MKEPAELLLDHDLAPGGRRLQLSAPLVAVRLLQGEIALQDGQKESWETITRIVKFADPFYGEVDITPETLGDMVRNFQADTYGQQVAVDIAHLSQDGAAGFVRALQVEGDRLRGRIEWTPFGVEAVTQRGFRYFSADYHENYPDPETGKKHGALLMGAALTTRPRVKRLDPVNPDRLHLSFDGGEGLHLAVTPALARRISQEAETTMNAWLKKLQERLEARKLAEPIVRQFLATFEAAAKRLGEDEKALEALVEEFDEAGRQLAESTSEQHVTLQVQMPEGIGGNGVSEDDVRRLVAEQRTAEEAAVKQLAKTLQAKRKLYTDAIEAADGLTDETKRELAAQAEGLISAEMSDDQVKRLGEFVLGEARKRSAAVKLATLGYGGGPAGVVHIQADEANAPKQLQETILGGLRGCNLHAMGRLSLAEKETRFQQLVLAEFDRLHMDRLVAEQKQLATGTTGISDTSLPVGFQRTVIREALQDLRVLELVQTLTDFAATATTQIPYEQRDTSAVYNNGVVYEAGAIHRASIAQAMDTAYIVPMKLAFLISNEVMHFSRASGIDWDAYARNVESNARVVRELIVRRICNEMQRSADAYGATAITDEAFDAQLDGSTSTLKTVQFPIVRPQQVRDIKGTAIGSVQNPIAITLNGTVITEWDGTGTQSAATYWRITSANLGYIQLVDEAGDPVTPADTGTNTMSYSYATNVAKFDLDNAGTDLDLHLNGLLRAIGARKAVLADDRFVMPEFLLMSNTLNDTCTNARNFEASYRREGTNLTSMGDLETIKGVPAWATNAPSVDLGDERILMGPRGILSYVIAKVWMTGQPFENVNGSGMPTGQKQAYGEEYSAIHIPSAIRQRLTSVVAYSATGR